MSQFEIDGKVALITGATGGIGKAVVKKLHSEGAFVVATDLNRELLEQLENELGSERLMALPLDVTDVVQLTAIRKKVVAEFGRVDFVFANAGIACDPPQSVATMPVGTFEKIIEVDLLGVTRTVKTFLTDIQNSHGHILVTASVYAFMNGCLNTPYAVSKAGVEMYGRALRAELAGSGATAGVLFPGWVDTNIAKNAFGGNKEVTYLAKRFYKGPYGKAVQPELIANAVSDGIKKRKSRIIAPARWAPLSLQRGVFNVFIDWVMDRDKTAHAVIKAIDCQSAESQSVENQSV